VSAKTAAQISPRKSAISLYVYPGSSEHDYLLNDLGKFKKGKGCICVKIAFGHEPEGVEKVDEGDVNLFTVKI